MSIRENREKLSAAIKAGIVSVRTFNSGGKGGQHGNRSFNAVQLIHLPTGITATATAKSQAANKVTAWRLLLSRVVHQRRIDAARERGTSTGFGPADRVRTYHALRDSVEDASGARASYSEIVGKNSRGTAIARLVDARSLEMAARRDHERRKSEAAGI